MQNMNSVRTLAVIGAVAGLAGLASAADWDELVNGDLASLAAGGSMLNLDIGTNSVSGTVGPPDTEDFVTFNVGAGQSIASVIITAVQFSGGNTSTGFRLYTDQGSGFFQTSSGSFTASAVGTDYLTVWNLSGVGGAPLGEGTYGILLNELGSAGQIYSFDINVVPTPGAAAVLGLGGLAMTRRRR